MTHPYQPAWKRREARGLDDASEPDELPGNPPADFHERAAAEGPATEDVSGLLDDDLDGLSVKELRKRAKKAGVSGFSSMNKGELVDALRS